MLPSLTIAIATLGRRALNIDPSALPAAEGLTYLVVVQGMGAEHTDPELQAYLARLRSREDLEVVESPESGLSRSRNLAIDQARTELMLVADDDIAFHMTGIERLRAWFADHPYAALAWGRSERPATPQRRAYPAHGQKLTLWNCGRIVSPELAIRLSAVRLKGIRFDENFGLGTLQDLGEEYIFASDCIKSGLSAYHVDAVVCAHPGESSGAHWSNPRKTAARAAIFTRVFGLWAPFVRAGYACLRPKKFHGLGHALAFVAGRQANR